MRKFSISELFRRKMFLPVYHPKKNIKPARLLEVESAWKGLELIVEDILEQFEIPRNRCIEFGVEFGYSAVVFSNFFKEVTGVDTFEGDQHTIHKGDHYEETKARLAGFQNIQLYRSDYRDWIVKDNSIYDFAHVDIVHNYKETFECGLWCVQHSRGTIFHDTESFREVRQAVADLAKTSGKRVFNFPGSYGLGIIVE